MHATTETGRRIHDDHARTIDILNRLEDFLEQTDGIAAVLLTDAAARDLITDLHRFLRDELEQHFDFEEQNVFPVLAQAGAHELTALLTQEHVSMRLRGRRLRHLCALALQKNFDTEIWPAFRFFAEDLAERMFLHLQQEETTLLGMVDVVFAGEAQNSVPRDGPMV